MSKSSNYFNEINDYRDQISSGIHQIYKLLITYYPEQDVSCLIKMRYVLDNDLQHIIDELYKNSVYKKEYGSIIEKKI